VRLSDNDLDAWLEKRKFRHQADKNTDTYRKLGDFSQVFCHFWHHVSLFYTLEEK